MASDHFMGAQGGDRVQCPASQLPDTVLVQPLRRGGAIFFSRLGEAKTEITPLFLRPGALRGGLGDERASPVELIYDVRAERAVIRYGDGRGVGRGGGQSDEM